MDLTKVKEKQANIQKEPVVEETKWEWPDAFYATTDAKQRKKELEKAMAMGLEPLENEIRMKIWNQRYGEKKGVDQMIAGWMNLNYFANIVKSDRKLRWHKSEVKELHKQFQFALVEEYGEPAKELLYFEIYHMMDFYIDMCKTDKKYGSLLFGIGSMSKEKVILKIATEIYNACYNIPATIGMIPEFDILRKAVIDCFAIKLPAYEKHLLYMINNQGTMLIEE